MKKFALLFAAAAAVCAAAQTPGPMKDTNGVVDNTLDSLNIARTARPVAGSSRKGDNPVLFLVGNSTMRTGTRGNGDNGQWGWGYYMADYFDPDKITVENHALGGTSSRTFYNKLWPDVLAGVKKGDWVIIELGHNDNGPYDSGRARASIPGVGEETLDVTIKETGEKETVYTYGGYMRKFVRDVKAKGATPVLFSLTPRNLWVDADSTVIVRCDSTYGLWASQVAKKEKVPYVDLNRLSADKYECFGKDKVKTMHYLDRIHTSEYGAMNNAESAAAGIRMNPKLKKLAAMMLPQEVDTVTGATRRDGKPLVFIIGDSTVKNTDKEEDGMWGWGTLFAEYVDTARIGVENHAKAGRSARTFTDEGRWDKVYRALKPGDFVIIQFGHNDSGDINTGKCRAELPGAGAESKVYKMENTGKNKVVYTYGWYLRKFIMDCREKGATPILLSYTPRNKFDAGKIESNASSFGQWTKDVAQSMGVAYIDLNSISGQKLQDIAWKQGLGEVDTYFKRDHTHTSLKGARFNAANVAEGIKKSDSPLKSYLR